MIKKPITTKIKQLSYKGIDKLKTEIKRSKNF